MTAAGDSLCIRWQLDECHSSSPITVRASVMSGTLSNCWREDQLWLWANYYVQSDNILVITESRCWVLSSLVTGQTGQVFIQSIPPFEPPASMVSSSLSGGDTGVRRWPDGWCLLFIGNLQLKQNMFKYNSRVEDHFRHHTISLYNRKHHYGADKLSCNK